MAKDSISFVAKTKSGRNVIKMARHQIRGMLPRTKR
jgi:hypothetical protein